MSRNSGNTVVKKYGCGLSTLLTVVFVVLKLCGVISWSWFWVFFPLILDIGLSILIAIIVVVVLAITTR